MPIGNSPRPATRLSTDDMFQLSRHVFRIFRYGLWRIDLLTFPCTACVCTQCPRKQKQKSSTDASIKKISHFLLRAAAMERPREVFPTPGGPTRHRTEPWLSDSKDRTAMYSTMRCFTWMRDRQRESACHICVCVHVVLKKWDGDKRETLAVALRSTCWVQKSAIDPRAFVKRNNQQTTTNTNPLYVR